ncbi:MAG: outer membrane protein [Chthoniobacter sp.]|jgi:outer membrane protein TolC|nr:outer membrane protein [Chthoniobacter sp.]
MCAVSAAWTAAALAADGPPPASNKPWAPPKLQKYEEELATRLAHPSKRATAVAVDPARIYTLPELIDFAQRSNPETRIAWERARQAAAAVGLSESFYYPYLVASAGTGYERAFIPFPQLDVQLNEGQLLRSAQAALQSIPNDPRGAIRTLGQGAANALDVSIAGGGSLVTDAVASRAALSVKWLLLDFGQRRAAVDGAKERLMMANVGFNATHQKVVFEVTERFYALNVARQKVKVGKAALRSAQAVEQAARARLDHGLATKPEFLQAQQQSAQYEFELEAAFALESDARIALVNRLGILPTTRLQVADVLDAPIDHSLAESVDRLVDRALSQRPDLVAKLANLRAKEAEVRKVRAEYFPKVALDAHLGRLRLDVSVADSGYFGDDHTVYGAVVAVEVPLFDGFARREKMRIAESEARAAESELEQARDDAVREVWKAYTDFKTALRKRDSAAKLMTAAENASAAVFEAYQHGLGTYTEVVTTQRNVAFAQSVNYETRAAIRSGAAALALSVGDLARPASLPSNAKASWKNTDFHSQNR